MSLLIVEVCRVDAVEPHPNADRMAIARIKGWDTCILRDSETGKTQFAPGDRCVFFPPDSVLPEALSDRLGVTRYLSALPKQADGSRFPGGRVRVANLRGFKSYGLIMPCEDPTWEIGRDVAAHYGVTKWEPPPQVSDGDSEPPHPSFHRYFSVENIRNFPDLFVEGEEVVVTEKIHGQNARLGLIRTTANDSNRQVWTWMAGSHDVRRKRFDASGRESRFWACFSDPIRHLLCHLSCCGYTPEQIDNQPEVRENVQQRPKDIVIFGERYGAGVQDMWYGFQNGQTGFRAFDISINGQYLGVEAKSTALETHGVEAVPVLYRGPFQFSTIEALAEGPTTVCPTEMAGRFSGREGVVVLPIVERPIVTEKHLFERLQLKCISFAYLSRKDGTEFH